MKRCPSCNRTYTDASLNFCLEDGTPLINESAGSGDPAATVQYSTRDTNPPATQIYSQPPATPSSPGSSLPHPVAPPFSQPSQWSPPPSMPVARVKKSGAVWWIVGGIAIVGVIGVGLVVMIIVLASMGSNSNNRSNSNRPANRNSNVNQNSNLRAQNTNTSTLPSLVTDDFSEKKWGTGKFSFGDIWYDNDEYHMRAQEGSYLVMYAPTDDYNTDNANVKVSVRSVNGTASPTGFGLIVHGEKSKEGELEDYALLIYSGDDPQYKVIKHKNGQQTNVVEWTRSSAIQTGASTNELEVRVRGTELSYYINGQYVDRTADTENFKRGLAGFYTSGSPEVAFDDLEIRR